MGRLKDLISAAQSGKDIQQRLYGKFPLEIAEICGPEEVKDILLRLQELSEEKENIEEWDGDSQDDIWRAQKNFSELLQLLVGKYPKEVALGLKSHSQEARFWVANAFEKSPSPHVVADLAEYLLGEMPEWHRKTGAAALKACKAKRGIFGRWF